MVVDCLEGDESDTPSVQMRHAGGVSPRLALPALN
jgi:hypothetical protein